MNKTILSTALALGALTIVLGAFGAHGLKSMVTADKVASYTTGVTYQMYHTLFLLFIGTTSVLSIKAKKRIFVLTLIGVVLFSFSIYLLSTASITGIDISSIAFVTPIGGVFLIAAWVMAAIKVIGQK